MKLLNSENEEYNEGMERMTAPKNTEVYMEAVETTEVESEDLETTWYVRLASVSKRKYS